MCLFRLAELYCVSTKMRWMSELMQFEIGMSTRRYLPPSGTAGFERVSVSGDRRVPAPPPKITARIFGLFGAIVSDLPGCCVRKLCPEHRRKACVFQEAFVPFSLRSGRTKVLNRRDHFLAWSVRFPRNIPAGT